MLQVLQTDNMDNVKHWIVSKCKEAGEQVSSIKSFRPDIPCKVFTNVVTPNSIPQFTIPGTSDSSSSCDDLEDPSYSCSAASSPRTSAGDIRNPSPLLVIPSPAHFSRSAPVSPSRPPQIRLQQQDSHSLSCLEDTNADPLSIAAVSLPHFRTTTRFGFQTVSENPHVRRKESLFHDGSNSNTPLLPRRGRVKHTSSDGLSTRSTSVSPGPRQRDTAIPDDLSLEDTFTRGRRSTRGKPPPTVVAPLGVYMPRCGSTGSDSPCVSPTPSSPLDSPSSTSDISKLPLCRFMTDSPLLRTDSKRSNYYYRRRSSVSIGSDTSGGDSSQTDENEQIPNFRKCPNGTIEPVHGQPIKRHSNPTVSRPKPPTFASGEIPKSQSLNSGISYLKRCKRGSSDKELEENRDGALLGELKLAIKYSEDERELKVTAIRAENLGGSLRQENNINPYLKLCLVPGKMQKQTSAIYKHCKNPVFQQDFWFNDVCLDELQRMRLRIRVCSKGHHIIGDEFLGEVQVTLSDLDLSEETRMWKRLEPKSDKEVNTALLSFHLFLNNFAYVKFQLYNKVTP